MLRLRSVSFRPLAGLSCINPDTVGYVTYLTMREFPSPRGVELHKPSVVLVAQTRDMLDKFPSPRGVELHKPCNWCG